MRRLPWLPALVALAACDRATVQRDVAVWRKYQGLTEDFSALVWLWLFRGFPPFRTLTYHRLRHSGRAGRYVAAILSRIYGGESTLHLICDDIGPGFYLLHGFATIVDAERIGPDCFIGHGVTIGHNEHHGRPTLGSGVIVYANAMVVGPVTVGDRARVAAMSFVNSDVPPEVVVAGIPARVLRPARRRAS